MSPKIKTAWNVLLVVSGAIGSIMTDPGHAASTDNVPIGRVPTVIVDGQYPASYFPNTELLGAGEMRIIALGTGMPNPTRAAAAISFLVELGNGDKFLFDVGSGSAANLFALRPDFTKLDKVFASHLHVDHVGDFMGFHIAGCCPVRNLVGIPSIFVGT